MSVTKIILLAVSAIAVFFIMVSKILARKAYAVQNKNLAKKSRLFETIGSSLALFAIGMIIRLLFLY